MSPKKDSLRNVFENIKAKDVMVSPVVTVFEDDELSVAEQKFVQHGLYYLPVINHNQQIVGLISHKYLYKTQSPRKLLSDDMIYAPGRIIDGDSFYDEETLNRYILHGMMRRDPPVLGPDAPLSEVMMRMAREKLSCIVIINAKKEVIGIVTNQDIVKYLAQAMS